MLELKGLTPAPAQVCGAFRLVPLLRDAPCPDVRLGLRTLKDDVTVVNVGDGTHYVAFVPHALILQRAEEGARAALGGQISTRRRRENDWLSIGHVDRMRKREGNTLRFLPLHLALEGFLALSFGPPSIAWRELSTRYLRHGLGERSEDIVPGRFLPGFDDALRTFELHDGQVGMLIFTADQLAAAFVVPSPEDYRLLHGTLLQDFYGELVMRYALTYPDAPSLHAPPDVRDARTLGDLRAALRNARAAWAVYTRDSMLTDILQRPLQTQRVYDLGGLRLDRFVTDLDPHRVNHIGERLSRPDGELLYLKTFQLSASQTRRGYLLSQLALHEWHLPSAARTLGTSVEDLVLRLERAGFGYLVHASLRDEAARHERRLKRER